jgi:C-terminal processing protease CtpA/Prc
MPVSRWLRRTCAVTWIAAYAGTADPAAGREPVPDPPAAAADRLVEALRRAGVIGWGAHGDPAVERAPEEAALGAVRAADPGARFGTEEEIAALEADRAGQMFRIGIELIEADGIPVVHKVVAGSPAAAASLSEGDQLESLDGQYVAGRSVSEIQEKVLAGGAQPVRLAVLRPGEARVREVTLVPVRVRPGMSNRVERLPHRIEWLRPPAIQDGIAAALAEARPDWSSDLRTGIVLDLRGIGGDSFAEAALLALHFGAAGAPALDPSPGEICCPLEAEARASGPRIVLVDARTRGAAEILAAALSGAPQTRLVGEPTSGDPLVRGRVDWREGWTLWAGLRVLRTADGRTYAAGQPVVPDARASPREPEEPASGAGEKNGTEAARLNRELAERIGDDSALRQAVDILLALRALSGLPAEDGTGGKR